MNIVSVRYGPKDGVFVTHECAREGCSKTKERAERQIVLRRKLYCSSECYAIDKQNTKQVDGINCYVCGSFVPGKDRHLSGRSTPSKRCDNCRAIKRVADTLEIHKRRDDFISRWDKMKWN